MFWYWWIMSFKVRIQYSLLFSSRLVQPYSMYIFEPINSPSWVGLCDESESGFTDVRLHWFPLYELFNSAKLDPGSLMDRFRTGLRTNGTSAASAANSLAS
jgi:hypothetical protein